MKATQHTGQIGTRRLPCICPAYVKLGLLKIVIFLKACFQNNKAFFATGKNLIFPPSFMKATQHTDQIGIGRLSFICLCRLIQM